MNSVKRIALLNGVDDFHFSEQIIEILAYAYHNDFAPIEAVAFLRLVANKMGDYDPNEVRSIEARAKDLMLLAKPDDGYNADLMREHVSRFIEIAAGLDR